MDRDLEKSSSFKHCNLGMQVSLSRLIHCRLEGGNGGGGVRTAKLVACWAGYRDLEMSPSFKHCNLGIQVSLSRLIHCRLEGGNGLVGGGGGGQNS